MSTDDEPLVWPDGSLVDVPSIEANAEKARLLAESSLDESVIRTPDWVIAQLALVSNRAARMVLVIHNAEAFKRHASTELARAKARARLKHSGLPGPQQTAQIVIDTAAEQDAFDVAVTAFEYARRIGNLLKDYTGRVQTIGRMVDVSFAGAGRGR